MKIRIGFVSNSSSSSFVLKKKNLTEIQLYMIKHHIDWGKFINKMLEANDYDAALNEHLGYPFYCGSWDEWEITETEETIEGDTTMNNFDMEGFFQLLGVDEDDYEFEEGNW